MQEFTPSAAKKLKGLLETQGGEHVRDSKIIRLPDGQECSIDEFGKVHWITPADIAPEKKEFWSHSPEPDSAWNDFCLIDQDEIFFDDENKGVVYKADGIKIDPQSLLMDLSIECILEEIMHSGHESRETFEHYIPDDWLEDFIKTDKAKSSLKRLLASWLRDNGQANHYTIVDSSITEVEVLEDNGTLTETGEG